MGKGSSVPCSTPSGNTPQCLSSELGLGDNGRSHHQAESQQDEGVVLLLATLQNHNRWRGWLALPYKATALSHHTALSSRDVPAQALPSGFHLAAPDQMTPPP